MPESRDVIAASQPALHRDAQAFRRRRLVEQMLDQIRLASVPGAPKRAQAGKNRVVERAPADAATRTAKAETFSS
jgi:hypothetical protein